MRRYGIFLISSILVSFLLILSCAKKEEKPYPNRQITLICPPAPGGISDLVSRTLAKLSEKELGVPVLVVNKTGGSGAIGMTYGAKSKVDGYTITYVVVEISILPHLGICPVNYDNFELLFRTNYNPAALTVRNNSPWKTLKDFLDYVKKNPKMLRVGNSGTASIWHLAAASLQEKTGVKFKHIPFPGAAPAVTALLGGHIDAVTVSPTEVQSNVEAGNLKMLAIFSEERDKNFPDVSTAKEQGVDVTIGAWGGIAVSKGTPKPIKQKIISAFKKAYDTSEFAEIMEKRSVGLAWMDEEEFKKFVEQESEYFGILIKKFNLKENI